MNLPKFRLCSRSRVWIKLPFSFQLVKFHAIPTLSPRWPLLAPLLILRCDFRRPCNSKKVCAIYSTSLSYQKLFRILIYVCAICLSINLILYYVLLNLTNNFLNPKNHYFTFERFKSRTLWQIMAK